MLFNDTTYLNDYLLKSFVILDQWNNFAWFFLQLKAYLSGVGTRYCG